MALLEIRDLTKQFFRLSALTRVSLSVEPGELLGLIGPNGSGKTTLFNCVTGVLRPSGGQVRFDGRTILHAESHERVLHDIAGGVEIVSAEQARGVSDQRPLVSSHGT